jgi:hypothetical protein
MEDFLKMMGWKYVRLDGGTKTEERALHVQQFNAKDSKLKSSSCRYRLVVWVVTCRLQTRLSCALSLAVESFSMLTRRFAALIVTGK